MSKIDKHFMRLVIDRQPETDAEEWRTSEEGHHFKIETETGEIKAGFGGKLNGQKVDPSKKKSVSGGSKPTAKKAPAVGQSGQSKPAGKQNETPEQVSSRFNRLSEAFGLPKGNLKGYTPEQQKKFFEQSMANSASALKRVNEKLEKQNQMLADPSLRGKWTEGGIKRAMAETKQDAYLLKHRLEYQQFEFEREYGEKPKAYETGEKPVSVGARREQAKAPQPKSFGSEPATPSWQRKLPEPSENASREEKLKIYEDNIKKLQDERDKYDEEYNDLEAQAMGMRRRTMSETDLYNRIDELAEASKGLNTMIFAQKKKRNAVAMGKPTEKEVRQSGNAKFNTGNQEFRAGIDQRTNTPHISSIHPYDETEYHWARLEPSTSKERVWNVYKGGKKVTSFKFNGEQANEFEEVANKLLDLDKQAKLQRTGGIW